MPLCNGIRRGRPVKAARYALRASRSVVVSLSLPRRNAASESEEKAVARCSWSVARKNLPLYSDRCGRISQRAAFQDGPYDGPGRGIFLRAEGYSRRCCQFEMPLCNGIRRGRPVKAARYALRAPRSVVVRLSLSRRNAASESEEKAVARCSWSVARKSLPLYSDRCGRISQRAAFQVGPYAFYAIFFALYIV